MNFCRRRFNLYLLPVTVLLLASGCQLFHHKKEAVAILRVHIESESQNAGPTKTISIVRSNPVLVNVSTDPILTEADVTAAKLLDTSGGGFAIQVQFEETAAWRLEQYTAGNPGKHLAIFAQWSDKPADGRWLAAPIIIRRMAGGTLVFTPDASRVEAGKLVDGLNVNAKKNAGLRSQQ